MVPADAASNLRGGESVARPLEASTLREAGAELFAQDCTKVRLGFRHRQASDACLRIIVQTRTLEVVPINPSIPVVINAVRALGLGRGWGRRRRGRRWQR